MQSADIVIFLKYSTIAKLKGILSRYIKNKGKEKIEIPGCREKMDFEFIKLTINWNKTKGKIVEEILVRNNPKKVIIFKKRKKLNTWYEKEFNKKIEI